MPHPLVADPNRPTRMVLYGVKHSHAPGKLRAMLANSDVEFLGACEQDPQARARAQDSTAFSGVRWLASPEEFLHDPTVDAVCLEGEEGKCSDLARQCVDAGKHLWYDKPVGDWQAFQAMAAIARERGLLIQMGYMLRYVTAFQQIATWKEAGVLGEIYAIRGHMSTSSTEESRGRQGYVGGIAFQLAPHIIDQVVWLMDGRPNKITSFLRNDATPAVPQHADNTLIVLEYDRGMSYIDVAHMEPAPTAWRFEVYGTKGSAIVVEPFEPGETIRLCLNEAQDGFERGAQLVPVESAPRTVSFPRELAAFVATVRGQQSPDRSLEHELIVEETMHRAVGTL
ncbi:MAG TPA: Gfo/Idh/MocA family oxidoreductase [Chloroflexota bacterium]|nr:Gfo/Idh/MocA family oxidoreductase [Chloroflexota bacterium]